MDVFGLFNLPVWGLILACLIILFIRYVRKKCALFPNIGVEGPRPWPIVGNLHEIIRKGFIQAHDDWFQKYGRVFGIHEGCHPLLMVGDLDMLRDITVKEFNNFPNRRNFNLEKVSSPPINQVLTMLTDDDWRHNRNTLTPTLTSGKLKRMTGCIMDAADALADSFKAKAESGEPVNVKQHAGAYTMDAIAACAFGIKLDTQVTPNDPFTEQARKFFNFSTANPVFLILFFFPSLFPIVKLLRIPVFPREPVDFFANIVNQALEERRAHPAKYADFMQLMINAEKQAQSTPESSGDLQANGGKAEPELDLKGHSVDKRKGKGLTNSEILAAGLIFFTAGYETTASTLSHALYHLATNQDCEDKLIAEIDEYYPQGTVLDYESIGKLPYLDMVVMEALRINPPIARMDRLCSRDTLIGGINIPAGMGVALPIYMIHHDPEYWPDPEVFDPERFTPDKKEKHHPLQWIPFGYGPRNCIGMRLAIFELKIGLVKIFQRYRLVPNNKTKPLEFGDTGILSAKGGVWLTVEKRS